MRLIRHLAKAIRNPRRALGVAIHHLLVSSLVTPLARVLGPRGLAWLACQACEVAPNGGAGTRVLVLNRLYFAKDVDQLRERAADLDLVSLDTHILSLAQMQWLPPELCEQIAYAARSRPEHASAWATAEAYAGHLLDMARARWDVAAVLASNVDYWQHESFRRACRVRGVPFLVLCQEEQTVRSVYELSLDMYRAPGFRYGGTAVAVFGPGTRDMLIESGCCSPAQVHMVGAPRFDPWLDGSVGVQPARLVTLLAFEGEQYFAPICYEETLRAFAAASVRHARCGLEFVLKCKDAADEARARDQLARTDHRLTLTNAAPLTELLPASRLVIGYNSLAVIEALFSDAEVVIPQWGDAARPAREQIVDPADSACAAVYRFASSPAELGRLLEEAVRTSRPQADRAARRALVGRWFHLPEEGASTATARFIRDHVAAAKLGTPDILAHGAVT
ncbi:MAG: hypothetical protein AB7Q81_05910 [Gammaproteobacteria bacterium]